MKKIFILAALLSFSMYFTQVAIGKTAVSNPSVSLEFANGNKGIILPWVTSAVSVTGAVDGTVIYDISDRKVKYRRSGTWVDLSIDTTGTVNTAIQVSKTESLSAKVAIGTNSSTDTTSGILVLTDTDKAMVLPKMDNPHLVIVNPAAGMMAYDTANHQLAVFNGTVWTFWRP
ncbi:hypothetical protein EGY05_14285 [Chryseobacterium arthrosphaerae]|uniref:hypothetical protein n=1 Tax=Chryseobacterium arthrosphaerae TaxID=651561 RepID=UPI000F5092B2|nr:hypothetical protein [Chryseobacterium arthrosphaerae]AYZ13029.1 hypothetical protein EGY05_14285 [Chryseobacterium arthrosphaerae]